MFSRSQLTTGISRMQTNITRLCGATDQLTSSGMFASVSPIERPEDGGNEMDYFNEEPPNAIEIMAGELTENLIQAEVITNAEDADAVFYAYVAEFARLEASL